MSAVQENQQPETEVVNQQPETEVVNQQPEVVTESEKENLKHFDFIHIATLHAVVFLNKLYKLAKENSGPLKPGVESVEGTFKTVVDPVYQKFKHLPFQFLKFVDNKVDKSMVPSVAKEVSREAQTVVSEVQRSGLVETATEFAMKAYTKVEPSAKEAYTKYEPIVEKYAAKTWRKLNKLPLFPAVANIMVPTVSMLSDKYNSAVSKATERGFAVSSYLPLVPKERIAKVFSTEAGSDEIQKPGSDESKQPGSDEIQQPLTN
ncbi:hypothetical protein MKX01_040536 [Papaver californicum]|nr:hypothetical protein MKX01_040536 [Papaver californicum]